MLEEILDDEFPKEITLRDGTSYTIRPLTSGDADQLHAFFQNIPKEDRLFLRDDVSDKSVIDGWCQNLNFDSVIPLVAEIDGQIVGETSLHLERRRWMSHIGRARLVVHPDFRRKGLALSMMGEIIEVALHTGVVEQVVSECMETQVGAIRMCEQAGFIQRAVMPKFVRDLAGDRHDLVVLSYTLREEEFHGID